VRDGGATDVRRVVGSWRGSGVRESELKNFRLVNGRVIALVGEWLGDSRKETNPWSRECIKTVVFGGGVYL
jgi:hypothetical protein